MKSLFRRLRAATAPPTLSDARRAALARALPFLARLAPGRRDRLHGLVARFLAEKTITPLQGLELDDDQRLQLAGLACLPLLEFGAEGLHGWSQLIVYPDAFRVNRSHVDAAGVMHEWDDELIGEAWDAGPVILSWADIVADCADPRAGYCVAVHEIAHKLDVLDGVLDGTPALPREWQREWARDFQAAYDAFCVEVDAGRETTIDPYAAEAPDEFFAVLSEYHFSDPHTLRAAMPAAADHLTRFYGPPPFA